ncbi:hypothetical protein HYE82_09530 [Streptomyces sp. BR123]|uniref:hypothetical protein n=1 Tax=Streptomyces sp. BR123 TaxID=2749828 RepID=UPI0015C4B600|nr:hypothetical protein [Streptomyces sp. BR123]NXY94629.1 hypothetical protein [Streptomyces sp. BR123]
MSDLEAIDVADDPLAERNGGVKILSDVQYGQSRVLGYVNKESCGILAHARNDPKENRIHLVAHWPDAGHGSASHPPGLSSRPGGPYHAVSGGSGPKAWASLMCSRNAMVISYVSGEPGPPESARGPVTATQVSDTPPTTRITVAEAGLRKQIHSNLGSADIAQ